MISNKMALNCTSLHQSRLLVSEVLLFSSGYRFKRVNDADLHLKGAVIYTLETPRASSSSSSPLRTQTQHPRVPLARPTPTGPPVLGDPHPDPSPGYITAPRCSVLGVRRDREEQAQGHGAAPARGPQRRARGRELPWGRGSTGCRWLCPGAVLRFRARGGTRVDTLHFIFRDCKTLKSERTAEAVGAAASPPPRAALSVDAVLVSVGAAAASGPV